MGITRSEFVLGLGAVAASGFLPLTNSVKGAASPKSTLAEFRDAVIAGDLQVVESLLGAEPALAFCRDERGASMFLFAHLAGQPKVADLIATKVGKFDVFDVAATKQYDRLKEILAEDPYATRTWIKGLGTSLHIAHRLGNHDMAIRMTGSNFDAVNSEYAGPTALRLAIEAQDPATAELHARNMLSNGANPNLPQPGGDTCLHIAASRGLTRVVKQLLRKGANVAAKNDKGQLPAEVVASPEIVALINGSTPVVQDFQISRTRVTRDGKPYVEPKGIEIPMESANKFALFAHNDLDGCKRMLIDFPRLPYVRSGIDEYAVEACAHVGMKEGVELLVNLGAPYSINTAAMMGDRDHVKKLLAEDKRHVHSRGPHDHPLVMYPVIAGGDIEMAGWFLDLGADVNGFTTVGMTALHRAVSEGQPEMIKFLLSKGADKTFKNIKGKTPVDLARDSKDEKLISAIS